MDLGTIIGFVFGLVCLVVSILLGGTIDAYIDVPSVFVTLGGGLASTVISYKLKDIIGVTKLVGNAFKSKTSSAVDTIAMMVKLSEKTRREGLLSIEPELEQMKDEFIKQSLQLVVDGIESETIKDFMDTEIENMQARHGKGQAIFKTMAALFPAWGMIGTLIGLINLLKSLNDPAQIGPAMSVALITTFYGSIMANFVCTPIANKLKLNSDEEVHQREMIAEAVISIQAGENPKMLEQKLKIFLKPEERNVAAKKETEDTDNSISA